MDNMLVSHYLTAAISTGAATNSTGAVDAANTAADVSTGAATNSIGAAGISGRDGVSNVYKSTMLKALTKDLRQWGYW